MAAPDLNGQGAAGAGSAAQAGARLFAVIYISKAARQLTAAELDHLCQRAQGRNLDEGVTGLLLYSDGAFMQYIEGPAEGLSRVYAVIKADPTHYGMVDLYRAAINQREYANWSMTLRDVGVTGVASPAAADESLLTRLERFDSAHAVARDLLSNFWHQGRPSIAATLDEFSTERTRRASQFGDT
jgi:hypothetical protein